MTTKSGEMNTNSGIMTKKVALVSLGCAKNLVNSEQMMYLLREAGYEVTGETFGADAVVINTCTFIESAKTEAIETILELAGERNEGKTGKIIVAGCLAERYKAEILEEMPEIDAIVGVGSFDRIVDAVKETLKSEARPAIFGNINAPVSESGRVITSSPVWTYIKIAEGCDNRCAFCIIPDIRGRFRSRKQEEIIKEAKELAGRGIKELIIVAQDVTRYGLDLYGERRLARLLDGLCGVGGIEWIRLHYLYPDQIDDELIDVIAENDKIVKYLDIPFQHINDGILRTMHRRGTAGEIRALIEKLRARIPGVVLRTSLIAGLPGEGEKEFEELCGFLQEVRIERAGIFAYSPEEGTAAALMDRPDPEVAARRAELLSDIQARVMDEYNETRIGNVVAVLVEGGGNGRYYGRSFAESPEVDGYITVIGKSVEVNGFSDVRITGIEDGEPVGVPCQRRSAFY